MADQTWLGPNDRRKRREVRYAASEVTGAVGSVPIRIRDVSLSGIGARCDQAVKAGKSYALVVSGRGATVELRASVRWCRMSVGKDPSGEGGVPYYGLGLQFDGLTDDQRRRLELVLGRPLTEEMPSTPDAPPAGGFSVVPRSG